ncbi:hypothetical protein M426DRAFT_140438 [Hypoxylon sp. CI-4A]|nr:hypothetical protein M426DRAFT_140438 [Hypoxylon sp. CI-4A]
MVEFEFSPQTPQSTQAQSITTPSTSKQKLSRTSTNKVRSGCITCKKRHIKCDEAKPHCNNCLRSRGKCEGYQHVAKPKKDPRSPPQLCWDSRQISRQTPSSASLTMQLQLDPDILDFRDAAGMLYFQEFVNLVQRPWVAVGSHNDLWEVTLPQLTRNNGTLRHAAIAIGALSMWHRQSNRQSLRAVSMPELVTAEEDTHYFHAVAYYCRSLKLQSQGASMQDAIFLSVLLLVFETLRGNKKAALNHVNHGSAILLALLTDKDTDYQIANFAPNPKPLISVIADLFVDLAAQARTVLHGRVGRDKPLPTLAKGLKSIKHSMESFVIMLSQISTPTVSVDRIPDVFNNLDEYEKYWAAARRAQFGVASTMVEIMQDSEIFGRQEEKEIKEFLYNLLSNERIVEVFEASRKAMLALEAPFLPLFNKIMMSDSKSPDYLRAIHLRLMYLGVYAFDDSTRYINIESLQTRTPFFREYLSLARIALRIAAQDTNNPAYQVSLQCGLSWRLLVMSLFCRDPLVRDEAVWMLRDYPGQDGLWNTRSLYHLALRNRHVERLNASEGSSEEQWQRLWRREFIFEDGGDRIVFRYVDKDEVTGEWNLIEEATELPEESDEVHWQRQPLTGSGGLLMVDLYAPPAD